MDLVKLLTVLFQNLYGDKAFSQELFQHGTDLNGTFLSGFQQAGRCGVITVFQRQS